MNDKKYHIPVLILPIISHFGVENNSVIFDGTLGFAGHAEELLSIAPEATYIGFDRDEFAIKESMARCGHYKNFKTVYGSFSSMIDYINKHNINVTHILLDLGVSSYQIDQSNRGFTFQKDETLDMRMNPNSGVTAKELLATYSKEALVQLFLKEGDISNPSKLVANIIDSRNRNKMDTSFDLINCIKRSFYFKSRAHYIAITTKVFQAIRVVVNNEMNELQKILADMLTLSDVTVAIITFQPNEDRIVKTFIKEHHLKTVQKKPFMATYNECKKNPREKSAKLRMFYI